MFVDTLTLGTFRQYVNVNIWKHAMIELLTDMCVHKKFPIQTTFHSMCEIINTASSFTCEFWKAHETFFFSFYFARALCNSLKSINIEVMMKSRSFFLS